MAGDRTGWLMLAGSGFGVSTHESRGRSTMKWKKYQKVQTCPMRSSGMPAAVERDDGLAAVRFYPGSNADASPHRYTMDPVAVIDALRDIDRQRWTLGAI